ncbi:TonB-dependent receptor [soil metagenome]
MNRLSLLTGSAIVACALSVSVTACAQDLRDFNIAAGPLGDALTTFASQSDQQILFTGDLVANLRTGGLRGRHTRGAALDRLLAGSGLAWSETRPGVLYLRRAGGPGPSAEAVAIDDVIVTGSLLRTSGELASPVLALNRSDLDARGLGTVAETLKALPQNYAGAANPTATLLGVDSAGSNSVFATGVNLRGLGPDATLVLVNGRRLAGTGFRGEFADVSALPSGAVERVDVLLDGASALYGSDAVAGVVNVILRRSFDGQESRVRVGAAAGGAEDVTVSHLAGRSWSSGAALISYEYQRSNAFSTLDRAITADADLRPFGGTDHRALFSGPGNVIAFDAASGGYVSRYAIRPGATGTAASPTDFVAGAANLQAAFLGQDLSPRTERHSVYGRVRQNLGDRLELSADLRFSDRDYLIQGATVPSVFAVSAANPYFVPLPGAAASQTIGYSFYRDLGPPQRSGNSRSLGVTAGADYELGRDWSVETYLSFAEERGSTLATGRVNSRFLNEALGNLADDPATAYSATRDGYFNPYGDGNDNSRAVLDFIGSGYTKARDRSRAASANLLVSGPLMSLPGGTVEAAFGLQFRHESFSTRSEGLSSTVAPVVTIAPEHDRRISAVFGELRIPLVGEANARSGLRSLELSLAGRAEEYDDFGTTTNPKIGLVWRPVGTLSVRASWGTSFRAPGLPQLHDLSALSVTTVPRGGANVVSLYQYGGNPDLRPETAETVTAGVAWRPTNGASLSLDLFGTEFTDRVAQPLAAGISRALTDPTLAPFVRLVSPSTDAADLALVNGYLSTPGFTGGALFPATAYGAILDGRWVNSGTVEVSGLDLSGRYPVLQGDHDLSLDASASWLFDYDIQTTPASPMRDVLDLVGYPTRLRARAGASWAHGPWTASAHWSLVSDYRGIAGQTIDAWNTVDVGAAWAGASGFVEGVQVLLSVQNLLDEDPPFYDSPAGYGFDAAQANVLGRTVALQLIKRW